MPFPSPSWIFIQRQQDAYAGLLSPLRVDNEHEMYPMPSRDEREQVDPAPFVAHYQEV